MRDRWMNVGYEEEELKPYIEPQPDYKDPRRTGTQQVTLRKLFFFFSSQKKKSLKCRFYFPSSLQG